MIDSFAAGELRARAIRLDDVDAIYQQWATDADVARFTTWRPHADQGETQRYVDHAIAGWRNDDCTWIIEHPQTQKIMGSFAARRHGHKIDIGYLLAKPYWGHGYMTEIVRSFTDVAFEYPDIHRVWAVHDIDNPASGRVLQKAGFSDEGVLKSWMVHPNLSDTPRDCCCFGMVRELAA
ncbi:GNAT family N-acetyltransferase [Gammaproteobacteria bacterium]|nr:GNAT family N-acetyltransferase [Gammaproteobacteria bacterium]